MKFIKTKKFKYGSISAGYTLAFVAAVLALNLIITALSMHFFWFFNFDMSGHDFYSISDVTHDLFNETLNETDSFEIVFMMERDRLEVSPDPMMRQIHNMALRYEMTFSFISVSYVDPLLNPELVRDLTAHTLAATISLTDIAIRAASGQFMILAGSSFFMRDQQTNAPVAFSGERRFTSAMLSLATSDAIAYFTVGHGEISYDDPRMSNFRELLGIAGFEIRNIDLRIEDIDPRARLIIINSPRTDFQGVHGEVNEIHKLQQFVDNRGHLMVFLDPNPNIGRLNELENFLDNRGISFNNNIVTESSRNALPDNYQTIWATYELDSTLGSSFHIALRREFSSPPRAVARDTRTLNIANSDIRVSPNKNIHIAPILTTSRDAMVRDMRVLDSNTRAVYDPILVVSQGEWFIPETGDTMTGVIIAGGSSSFISNDFLDLESPTFANNDIMWAALRAMITDNLDPERARIEFAPFFSEALAISSGQANTWMIVISAVIPAAIMTMGTVVFFKRRYL